MYGAVQAMVTPLLEFIEVDGTFGVSGIVGGRRTVYGKLSYVIGYK